MNENPAENISGPRARGFIGHLLAPSRSQPTPDGWGRVPSYLTDVVASSDEVGVGWSATSVLLDRALITVPDKAAT